MGRNATPTGIARHSISYIVTFISEILRTTSLDVLDVLITLTISSANDAAGRGTSRTAVSRVLAVPLETVRRRVGALIEDRVIEEGQGGLFVPAISPLGALDNHAELVGFNARMVRRLLRDLKAVGVRFG